MKKFYQLRVSEISRDTEDSVLVSFDVPDNLAQTFTFTQGQYLTINQHIKGEELRRSYSLCSSPLDQRWTIGIKKIPGGRFSTFANEVLQVDDKLQVMPPDGKFYVPIDTQAKRNFVAFAAGSGITPICSIIKTHLEREPDSSFKLFYVNQTSSTIMLKEPLEALKNQYMDRLEICYFLTREQRSIPLFNGRLDEEKLETLSESLFSLAQTDHYFMCGPEAMIQMIDRFLKGKGVAASKIHFELFGTSGEVTQQKKQELEKAFKGKTCDLTIIEGGKSLNFMAEQGVGNVLDLALSNAADLPFACKGGVCATCRAKIVEGEVDMLLSYGLEQDEIDAGYILTCQSVPTSDKLIVDFDC